MTLFQNKYRIESTRLPNWDYRSAAAYFVTICTANRQPFFGKVENGDMILSPIGEIACEYWLQIPQHTIGNVELDAFIVMPNHVHGILILQPLEHLDKQQFILDSKMNSTSTIFSQRSPKAGSLSAMIRSYKAAISAWCSRNGYVDFAWQSRFYEHIIRDEQTLAKIRSYIENNPYLWNQDEYYLQ